ncbi:MAG: InlB B-repeat-containing protein [Treponema sp.]|nr:InlB B-repeat-containing protein [Treponema sp.]
MKRLSVVFALSALVFAACQEPGSISVPVTFSGNGHTGGMVVPSALLGPAGISMPMPVQGSLVKTAYTFRGWNTQANGSGTDYAAGGSYAFAADTTLYARWKADWTGIAGTASIFGTSLILGIAYGGGKFVAVGEDGKMARSADGVTWDAVGTSTFGTSTIVGIAYGGGKFVAVGGFEMAWSADGVTWSPVITSTFGPSGINGIAYGGGKFVAVGFNGRMAWSADGVTWSPVVTSTFGPSIIQGIAYGGGKFVAGGDGGTMAWHEYP